MPGIFRYPGAQPFSTHQKNIFFGRESDVEKLYELVSLEELVVLYSKSGLGKSSLLNAGLIPKIDARPGYEATLIRFGAYTESKTESPVQITSQFIRNQVPAYPLLEKIFGDDGSLWFQAKTRQLQGFKKGHYLIFDQFEELLTYPEEHIIAFKDQLAELLHTEIPNRFRVIIENLFEKSQSNQLNDDELDLIHQPLEIRVVIAIRSDRMSLLNHLSDVIPSILKTCYELGPLSIAQAEEAILNPAYKNDLSFLTPPFDYEDAALERIFNYLTNNGKEKIESFQLQILCQALERRVLEHDTSIITLSDVENIEDIYSNYYQNQIAQIPNPDEQIAARKLIEEALILEEEERRLSLYEGQIYRTFGFSPQLLTKLVDVRLLRAEPSLKGGYTYELTHDTIVAPILKAKHERLSQEKQQAEIEAQKEKEKELELLRQEAAKEKRKRLQNRSLAILGFSLAFIALISTLNSYRLYKAAQQAINQTTQELTKRVKAEYFRLIAEGKQQENNFQFAQAIALYDSAYQQVQAYPEIDSGGLSAEKARELAQQAVTNYQQFQTLITEAEADQNKGVDYFPAAMTKFQTALNLVSNEQLRQMANNKIEALQIQIDEAFERLKQRGNLYLQARDYPRACRNYKRANELKPDDQYILGRLSECN